MKFGIVGPGAMGTFLAGMLGKENEIVLLGKRKEENIDMIEIEGKTELETSIFYTSDPSDLSECEYIIISTKSYDTRNAMEQIASHLSSSSVVLSLQNGLNNEKILADFVGEDRVIGGITSHGVTFIEPGLVRHAGTGKSVIGPYSETKGGFSDNKIPEITEEFENCGLETEPTDHIYPNIWKKVIINSAINPLTALAKVKNGALLEIDELHWLLMDVGKESLSVAKKDLALDVQKVKDMLNKDKVLQDIENVAENTAENTSSMLQDVENERKTEIGCINGAIVDIGNRKDIETPLNAALLNLIMGREKGYLSR